MMKYFEELSKIESLHIKLEGISAVVSMLPEGLQSLNHNESQAALYNVDSQLREVVEELKWEFQNLWDTVREDSFPKEKKKSKK